MPCIVAEAFNVIADETHQILKESDGGSKTGPDSRGSAE